MNSLLISSFIEAKPTAFNYLATFQLFISTKNHGKNLPFSEFLVLPPIG